MKTSLKHKVSIIILTWNGLDYTKKCLESLGDIYTDDNVDVIVVDNGSTDGTLEYLSERDGIRLIANEQNLGFVKGNNIAINQIDDGDILLLNNDIIITQADWLEKMQVAVYENDEYGIAGCRLIDEKHDLLHAGTYIYPETFWGQQIGGGQKDINQYAYTRQVQGVVFACAYIKRCVLDAIGGLNEAFFSYFEDTDYCLRAAEAGYKTICCGDVTLMHYQNVSTNVNQVDFSDMFLTSQGQFKNLWSEKLTSRYTLGCAWHSIVNVPSEYTASAKNMMLALDDLDVDIRYRYVYGKGTPFLVNEPEHSDDYRINVIRQRAFSDDLPQIVYGLGNVFRKNTGRYKIGYTMLETMGIPGEWVRQANMMDEVWVPSSSNAQTFRDSGVTVPIYTVPLGIDPNYFNPKIRSYKKHSKYTFLSIFEWGERHAPEVLLRAYSKAFTKTDDVLLVCKISSKDASVDVESKVRSLGIPDDGPEIVLLCNHHIADYQMPTLYRSADCFVLPTRSGGWGMPMLEAMACGLPVIATKWGSHTDFMDDENSYPLDTHGLVPASSSYYEGFQWADPSEEHLVHLLRHVYTHQDEARQKGDAASAEALESWTWSRTAETIKQRLELIDRR